MQGKNHGDNMRKKTWGDPESGDGRILYYDDGWALMSSEDCLQSSTTTDKVTKIMFFFPC